MAIPEEIRRVARPKNTVVVQSGSKGANLYAVRERAGFKYGPKGNPQPINGRIIGHIVDGRYVPLHDDLSLATPDMLSYGASAFIHSCSEDLLQDLYDVYSASDAQRIMALASLRVLKPKITARRVGTEYRRTFISRYYPDLALSANTISTFLQKLGEDGAKRETFYKKRISLVEKTHHVAIDGTLKQDSSSFTDLSAFSRKARVKGCRDISVIYAYDLERMEPLCAEVFPGNSIDATSYRAFIVNNDIRKGIVLSDKGFPPKQIAQELRERPDLHFLTPLKRNDSRIAAHEMYEFQGVLKNFDRAVFFKKAELSSERFLYSFRDTHQAELEEHSFAEHAKKHEFDSAAYLRKKAAFGTIVFESDQDLDPEVVYRCYEDRWQIELVFRRYKNGECLDQTSVQGDFSVIGSEFINFISTTLTCRMLRKAEDAGLLKDDSWADLMDDLSSAWRRVDGSVPPQADDPAWVHTIPKVMNLLTTLGLAVNPPKETPANVTVPGKRGRPKGSRNKSTLERLAKESEEPRKPKRGPGRPKGAKNKKTLEREARERALAASDDSHAS